MPSRARGWFARRAAAAVTLRDPNAAESLDPAVLVCDPEPERSSGGACSVWLRLDDGLPALGWPSGVAALLKPIVDADTENKCCASQILK